MITPDSLQNTAVRGLTCRQAQVYDAMAQYYAATGEACSVSYVARRLSLSRATVREHLEALARKGWLPAPCPASIQPHLHTRHI
jgi:transcriptional regulator of heat shock response